MNRALVIGGALLFALPCRLAGQADAAGQPNQQTRSAYMERCAASVATTGGSIAPQVVQSICESRWEMVVTSGPIAIALLAIATPSAGVPAGGAAAERLRTSSGTARLSGDVALAIGQGPPRTATVSWEKSGEPIPFDLADALTTLGETVDMVGCLNYGAAEGSRAYRVSGSRHESFWLTIAFRSAAVASQSSSYNAIVRYGGSPVTLAELRKDGEDWTATCPT